MSAYQGPLDVEPLGYLLQHHGQGTDGLTPLEAGAEGTGTRVRRELLFADMEAVLGRCDRLRAGLRVRQRLGTCRVRR